MSKEELENLARIGQLKHESPTRAEFNGMVSGAKKRLADAQNEDSPLKAGSIWHTAQHTASLSLHYG